MKYSTVVQHTEALLDAIEKFYIYLPVYMFTGAVICIFEVQPCTVNMDYDERMLGSHVKWFTAY